MFSIRVLILGGLSLCAAASASLASDRIVFLRIAPTESTLYIANADGSDEQPLTQPGSMNYNPAWSARGDWIAFTSDRAGSADLFRVHPDGTGLERLTDDPAFDDQAAFSPDGKRIVFVSTRAAGRANLWTLDISTRRVTRLTSGDGGDFRPAWSPDGQWIAFSSDRGSELPSAKGRWERLQLVDLYVIHPDGTGLRRVSQHGNFCGSPKWLSDGKHLIADCMSAEETWDYRVRFYPGQQSQIFKVDIASGSTTALTTGPDVKLAPSVLPSGEIAYVLAGKSAKTIVYAGGKAGPTGADLARNPPSWSPDARRIVYCRQKFNRTPEPQQLWSRDPKFSLYTTTFLPAYDFKGEHLAVTKTDADGTSLYLIEDGKPAQAIMQRKDLILAPQWSPDGKQIVVGVGGFTSFLGFAAGGMEPADPVNGGAEVGILNADGTGFHVLTSGVNNNAFASFSPDGKQIVYRTAGPEGQGLRIMNLEDRSITVLTDEFGKAQPGSMLINLLPRLIERANRAVHDCALDPQHNGQRMATTIVACALRYDQAVISHVGDSRCYLVRNGQARQITQDHTLVNEQRKMGLISADDIASSDARHVLIRSVGPEMFVSADTTAVTLQPGDVLILCTDGMHDELREPEIASIASQKKDATQIARELVARAVEIDGGDNTTAQVIRVRAVEQVGMYRGRPYRLPI